MTLATLYPIRPSIPTESLAHHMPHNPPNNPKPPDTPNLTYPTVSQPCLLHERRQRCQQQQLCYRGVGWGGWWSGIKVSMHMHTRSVCSLYNTQHAQRKAPHDTMTLHHTTPSLRLRKSASTPAVNNIGTHTAFLVNHIQPVVTLLSVYTYIGVGLRKRHTRKVSASGAPTPEHGGTASPASARLPLVLRTSLASFSSLASVALLLLLRIFSHPSL
jgi:hypothetical protein